MADDKFDPDESHFSDEEMETFRNALVEVLRIVEAA